MCKISTITTKRYVVPRFKIKLFFKYLKVIYERKTMQNAVKIAKVQLLSEKVDNFFSIRTKK